MASYTFQTAAAREDQAIAYKAKKEGQTVAAYLQDRWLTFLVDAVNEYKQARTESLVTAYVAATAAVRGQVDDLLGLP